MKLPLPSIRFIRTCLKNDQYRLTKHATIFRMKRGITIAQLKLALSTGEIIE